MKHGIPDRNDGETLRDIYKKLDIYGHLKKPLTIHEMVTIFCIGNWLTSHADRLDDDLK